jgi:hypothetical protein
VLLHVGIGPDELLPDLRCAPAWLVLLEAHDPRLDLDGQLVGMAIRQERVGETVEADRVVAGKLRSLCWMFRPRKDGR